MPVFEFEIHNNDVAEAVKAGERHRFFKDEWASPHFFEFPGNDVDEARRKAERRYPVAQGFVISGGREV